jgi:sirohydrochlorin ferrochelatase
VVAQRLVESGWRTGDSVILAAAGTSDPTAMTDLRAAATVLSAMTGARVELGFAATGSPRIGDAVAAMRDRGAGRVFVASYLLAEGLFQDRLRASGADVVTEPLGLHPSTVRFVASRFRRARLPRDLHHAFG